MALILARFGLLCALSIGISHAAVPELKTSDRYAYMSLARYGIPSANNQTIMFEVKACKNAIIALVSGDKKALYEVVLGSRDNTMIQIRQGRNGAVVASTAAATGLIRPLDCRRYRPYYISWQDGWIWVGTGNVRGKGRDLAYRYVSGFDVKYVAVATFGASGDWRLNTECRCVHGGVCMPDPKDKTKWMCSCPPEWSGTLCSTKCPCKNGGRCVQPSTKCKCTGDFSGEFCESDKCDCKNGGQCKDGRCICKSGFMGNKCEIKTMCCRLWGDPHMITFDGARMDFQGSCRYQLVSKCGCAEFADKSPSFAVEAKTWRRGKVNSRVSWVKSVTAHVSGHSITIGQKGEVLVNGFKKTLPYKRVPHAVISKEANGRTVRVDTDFGATVRFDGRAVLMICVPDTWMERLCGLCGNYDGNRDNDYVTKQGDLLKNYKKRSHKTPIIAASWRVPNLKGETCEEVKVPEYIQESTTWQEKAKKNEYCGLIVARTGPYAKCIARLAPTKIMEYYNACLFDVVEVSASEEAAKAIACNSLEAFANECDELNLRPALRWRTITSCKVTCPTGMTYKEDVTACPNSCANPNASATCRKENSDGCACPEGTLLSGNKCVNATQCGCTDKEGNYYEPNDYAFSDDCKTKYVCQPGTADKPSAILEKPGCSRDEICKMKDGVAKCIPVPVNGDWSDYSKWSSCFMMPGQKKWIRLRTRACDNPMPKNGGSCRGNSLDMQTCVDGKDEL